MGKHKEKSKKHDKKHKDKKKYRSRKSSSSSSSSDEWVEKDNHTSSEEETRPSNKNDNVNAEQANRDEWLSLPTSFLTESNLDKRRNREENKRLEKERSQYNPREHVRELNPYWKDGGDGLPKFKKPSEDERVDRKYESINRPRTSSNWRRRPSEDRHTSSKYDSFKQPANWRQKKSELDQSDDRNESAHRSETSSNRLKKTSETGTEQTAVKETVSQEGDEILSEKELNIIASKLVKAEIMGKTELVKELKAKLEAARSQLEATPKIEEVLLTQTDLHGHARPVKLQSNYGEFSGNQKKKRKVETHQDGQRVRYFPDDDKHSLKQMFENEKFNTVEDQNKEFINMASQVRKNDDLEDIFADNIRKKESDSKKEKRDRDRAINEHQKVTHCIDSCKFCLQSDAMPKHLMVTLGETVFLRLPAREPLTQGHCLIVPIRHVTCSTLLDENEWEDIRNFRRALTKMYNSRNEDVIFFEMAKNFENYPHMYIECVPLDKEEGDTAPIYFKKAIDECEAEWAQNKKLVSLKGRDVRRAVPKGLPYFFVSFGMEEGFAHVIEDQKSFPHNFAQEIIGGMLDLHHSKWRKPRQQNFEEQSSRVIEFSKEWDNFDCTKT